MLSKHVDFSDAIDQVVRIYKDSRPGANVLVLIGGCSRSGKSTLAEELKSVLILRGLDSILVSADCWLLPASKRPPNATVIERYKVDELSNSVMSLLRGESVDMRPYDSKTRALSREMLTIKSRPSPSIVVVEGVVTLAVETLRKTSAMNLFVESSDLTRLKRLIRFYRDFKILRKSEYRAIIKEREIEEVPLIKATRIFADMVLTSYKNSQSSIKYDNILQRADW